MTLDELKSANVQMQTANELAQRIDEFDKTAGFLQIALDRNEPGQPFVKKKSKMKLRFWNRKNKNGKKQGEMLWFRDLDKESYGHEIMIDERVLECLRDHFQIRRDELIAELNKITIGGSHES
jgi:hypothetical protein